MKLNGSTKFGHVLNALALLLICTSPIQKPSKGYNSSLKIKNLSTK